MKLQSLHRGRKARKEAKEQGDAAVKLQSLHRGRKARKEAKEQGDAAVKLQSLHRGRKARKEAKEQGDAAVKLQSLHRGRKARKDNHEKKGQPQKYKLYIVEDRPKFRGRKRRTQLFKYKKCRGAIYCARRMLFLKK